MGRGARRAPGHRQGHGVRRDDAGILRIDFQDPDDKLEEISWDDWFRAFDENNLAFLYEDEGDSRFNKLVNRDS